MFLRMFPGIRATISNYTFTLPFIRRWSSTYTHTIKNPYVILGVGQTASTKEIRDAFYSLAQKYHPDKNPSENAKETFAEINNAYEVIGNPESRKKYDFYMKYGEAATTPLYDETFTSDEPSEMAVDISEYFNFANSSTRPPDVKADVHLTFMEAALGTEKRIVFPRQDYCGTCKGARCEPGSAPSRCSKCHGRGKVVFRHGIMPVSHVCKTCYGRGITIKKPCLHCQGAGMEITEITETVNIPAGVQNGTTIIVPGVGNRNQNNLNHGNLNLNIHVMEDMFFKRTGFDIHTHQEISALEAVLGGCMVIKTIHGDIRITFANGVQNGDKIVLHEYGVLKDLKSKQKGNHVVTLAVNTPKVTSSHQKRIFEELLKFEEAESNQEHEAAPETNNEVVKKRRASVEPENQNVEWRHDVHISHLGSLFQRLKSLLSTS